MALRIEYVTTSQWSTGFTGEVFIHNDTAETVRDYEIGFDLAANIVEVWGGVLKVSEGGHYVVVDDDDNNDIAPGETARFKFKAYGDADACRPMNYTINGRPLGEEVPDVVDEVPDVTDGLTDTINVAAGTRAAAIQNLIDSAADGTTIRLAKGDFWLDRPLEITRDGIRLEGAGDGLTRLHMTYDEGDNSHAIHVQGGSTDRAGTLSSSVNEGGRTISVSGDHGIRAGDTLLITQPNDSAYLDSIGDELWRESAPLRESLVRVSSVSGSTIRLENGVHFDFSGGKATVHEIDLLKGIELSGFSIEFGLGAPDPGEFANTLDGFKGTAAVKVDGTIGARIQDITINNSPSSAFEFERALNMSGSDLEAHGAHNKGAGGNGYAVELRDVFDSSFTGLEDTGMRHSVVFASWHSEVGNQVHVRSTDRDINFHGGPDHDNVVRVDESVRNPEYDNLSPVLSVNKDGASYGAPTDPDANEATFGLVWGSKRDDIVQGRNGGAELHGRGGDDGLSGGTGNDLLDGGAGEDVLYGGSGRDLLTGGLRADRFQYNSATESKPGSAYRDVITDFNTGEDDIIDLSTIDANTGLTGNQKFAFIGGANFSRAGQLQLDGDVLKGNTDSDLTPEFEIEVHGVTSLSSGDFWL